MCTDPERKQADLKQERYMKAKDDSYEKPIAPIHYMMSEYLEKLLLFEMYAGKIKKNSFPDVYKVKQTKILLLIY